jgi:hypothetical protein
MSRSWPWVEWWYSSVHLPRDSIAVGVEGAHQDAGVVVGTVLGPDAGVDVALLVDRDRVAEVLPSPVEGDVPSLVAGGVEAHEVGIEWGTTDAREGRGEDNRVPVAIDDHAVALCSGGGPYEPAIPLQAASAIELDQHGVAVVVVVCREARHVHVALGVHGDVVGRYPYSRP